MFQKLKSPPQKSFIPKPQLKDLKEQTHTHTIKVT